MGTEAELESAGHHSGQFAPAGAISCSADDLRRYRALLSGEQRTRRASDSGCGMAPEVLARAFEPFFTTREVGAGNGLGLSLVYGFARQSQGHVSIDSRPGAGTRVRLYFPRSDAAPG